MNKFESERRFAERMKRCYPPGTRLVLLSMDDPYAPMVSTASHIAKTIRNVSRYYL